MTRTHLFAIAGTVGVLMTGTWALAILALNLGAKPYDDTGMSGLGGGLAALALGGIVTVTVAGLMLRRAAVPGTAGLAVLGCLFGWVGSAAFWPTGRGRFTDLASTWVPWAAWSLEVIWTITLCGALFVIPTMCVLRRWRELTATVAVLALLLGTLLWLPALVLGVAG